MIKIRVSKKQHAFIKKKYSRKNRVINKFVIQMEEVLKNAVESVFKTGMITNTFVEPPLVRIGVVLEEFYRDVLTQAFKTSQDEKKIAIKKVKKLSKLPEGIPRSLPQDLRGLEKLFRDRRLWPMIMKRSKILEDRLRKAYLQKLRRKFNDLMPKIRAGELHPADAKKKMMKVWDASKSRVELIFRTETTKYFGKVQVAFFKGDPDIIGFQFDSIPDKARTDICRCRHGLIFRPDHNGKNSITCNTPPCHYNCRSHFIALANTEENVKMVADPRLDPENKKLVDLPKGWR